ncbi:MAG TPA: hypothetical protein VKZ79_22035 [Alphaproteobacteria bacterium]|nr:hypothetical protein [Alphaproteobacteria bacterium]
MNRSWFPHFNDLAPTLLQNGYSVVPIRCDQKEPHVKEWRKECDERIWLTPEHRYCYTGIRTGFNNVVAFDISTSNQDRAQIVEKVACDVFGRTSYIARGRWPRRVLYRILTTGQQFGAFATPSDSKRPYEWWVGRLLPFQRRRFPSSPPS